jgi:CRP-like cAMP-binding protein
MEATFRGCFLAVKRFRADPRTGSISGAPRQVSLCCAAMARQSYLDHLASVSLFSACSKKELQAVAKATDEISVSAGRTLCEQGTIGREAFIVVEGTAEAIRNGKKVATFGPGTCVGELALLDHGPRTATVTAKTDLKVLVLGAREFAAIIDEVPPLAHKLMRSLAAKVRELDTKAYG